MNATGSLFFWLVMASGAAMMLASFLLKAKPGGSEDSDKNPSQNDEDDSGWGV